MKKLLITTLSFCLFSTQYIHSAAWLKAAWKKLADTSSNNSLASKDEIAQVITILKYSMTERFAQNWNYTDEQMSAALQEEHQQLLQAYDNDTSITNRKNYRYSELHVKNAIEPMIKEYRTEYIDYIISHPNTDPVEIQRILDTANRQKAHWLPEIRRRVIMRQIEASKTNQPA